MCKMSFSSALILVPSCADDVLLVLFISSSSVTASAIREASSRRMASLLPTLSSSSSFSSRSTISAHTKKLLIKAVLRIRIRIHRVHMFLGLLDPDPDLLVEGMDPDPSIIKQKYEKPLFLLFCDFFLTFYLSKSNMQKNFVFKIIFCLHLESLCLK